MKMIAACTLRLLVLFALPVIAPRAVVAQLNGFNIKGDLGLKSGSQPAPGGYVTTVFYLYNSDTIKDSAGNTVPTKGEITAVVGVASITYITTKKLFGANYGFATAPLILLNSKIDTPRLDFDPSAGFGDISITPISLGWHFKRADVTTACSLFLPTGRYSPGANDNTGLDM